MIQHKLRRLWAGLLALLVVGCSDQESDLVSYIEQVKAIPPSEIEALPKMVVIDDFEFDAENVRDLFKPLEMMAAKVQAYDGLSNALHPDYSRLKQA